MVVEWAGKKVFFGLGPPFLGWVGGCFSLFLSYFFGTRSVCVWVGKRFFGALACVTHLSSSEGEEEEEKGTTDVASSDGAGLANPPSQKNNLRNSFSLTMLSPKAK